MRPVPDFQLDFTRVRDEVQALREQYHLPGVGNSEIQPWA